MSDNSEPVKVDDLLETIADDLMKTIAGLQKQLAEKDNAIEKVKSDLQEADDRLEDHDMFRCISCWKYTQADDLCTGCWRKETTRCHECCDESGDMNSEGTLCCEVE